MTGRPFLATVQIGSTSSVDPRIVLDGLRKLADLLERRSRLPWNLLPWTETGPFRAAAIGLRARVGVSVRTEDDENDLMLSGPSVGIRAYRIPGHGRIAVFAEGMTVPGGRGRRDAAAAAVAFAIRSIRTGMDGPDPSTLQAGLAAACAVLDPVEGSKGWRMPTPFAGPAHYVGADEFTPASDDPRIPQCVLVTLDDLPGRRGFDVFISHLFVGRHHADDVMGALRDAGTISSIDSATSAAAT